MKTKFDQFQKACPEHNRNRQEKRKLSSHSSGRSDQKCTYDRRAGAGSTRDQRQYLKAAYEQRHRNRQLCQSINLRRRSSVFVFNDNKSKAIQDQGYGNHHIIQ